MSDFNFEPFPVLVTDNYILRRLDLSDAPSVFILRTDENVNRFIFRKKATSVDDAIAFIKMIDENVLKNESILWAICSSGDQSFVGSVCLWNFNKEKAIADIGYELLPEFQGQGVFREVMPVVIDYAFKDLRLQAVEAFVHPDNERSIKLLEASGFLKTGVVDEFGEVNYRRLCPA